MTPTFMFALRSMRCYFERDGGRVGCLRRCGYWTTDPASVSSDVVAFDETQGSEDIGRPADKVRCEYESRGKRTRDSPRSVERRYPSTWVLGRRTAKLLIADDCGTSLRDRESFREEVKADIHPYAAESASTPLRNHHGLTNLASHTSSNRPISFLPSIVPSLIHSSSRLREPSRIPRFVCCVF
jgi:hypothetical protein